MVSRFLYVLYLAREYAFLSSSGIHSTLFHKKMVVRKMGIEDDIKAIYTIVFNMAHAMDKINEKLDKLLEAKQSKDRQYKEKRIKHTMNEVPFGQKSKEAFNIDAS
jgi:hypothetical protein